MSEVDFYFDIVCPFAYLASTQINQLCSRYNVTLTWKPVLLGGLYEFSKAKQGKQNSAMSVVPPVKRLYFSRDAQWQQHRFKITQKYPTGWPTRTLPVQRLLTAITDNQQRMECAQRLYHDLWVENVDITKRSYLQSLALEFGTDIKMIDDPDIKRKLTENTRNATRKYNMFGVPTMVVRVSKDLSREHVFFGVDRLPFLNMLLRDQSMTQTPKMLLEWPSLSQFADSSSNSIEFFFDFASPFSFLGYMRLHEFKPFADRIILKPVVLGALFKAAGTVGTPMARASPIKAKYMGMDMQRWFTAAGVPWKMNSKFPLRTILPLRVFLVDHRTVDCIFKGCWQSDIDISNPKVLRQWLDRNGFDGAKLIERASTDKSIKQELKDNSEFAVKKKMFGVPTYVVNQAYDRFCFGQDRMYFVKDLCRGWKPPVHHKSNL